MPIEFVNVPVEFEVKAQAQFELTVPITVLPNAVISDKPYEFKLCFRGPNGNQFGEQIPLKIRVIEPEVEKNDKTELEMYTLAYKLLGLYVGKNF